MPLVLVRVMAGSSGVSQLILLKRQIVRGFGYGVYSARCLTRRKRSFSTPNQPRRSLTREICPQGVEQANGRFDLQTCGTRLVRRSGAIPEGSTSPASTLGLIDEPFVPAFTLAVSPRADTRATPVAASQVVPSPTNKPAPVANWHLNYEAVACLSYPAVNMPSWICLGTRMDTALAQ